MDNAILKKRLSTFRSEKGKLTRVRNELLVDILSAWKAWQGMAKDFHVSLGMSKTQLGGLIGKAKKLRREGKYAESELKEINVEGATGFSGAPCGIELAWDSGKVIRFSQVEQLVDFLKKVA